MRMSRTVPVHPEDENLQKYLNEEDNILHSY